MIAGKVGTLLELVSSYQNGKPSIVIRGTGDLQIQSTKSLSMVNTLIHVKMQRFILLIQLKQP